MSPRPERPVTILLATRLEAPTAEAAAEAADLARRTGGEVVVCYVAEELETAPRVASAAGLDEADVRAEMRAEVVARVREFADRHLAGLTARTRVAEGDVVRSLVDAAREERADYLVVGTEVHNPLRQLVIGSTTHGILRRAPCPVLVVHTGRRED